MSTKLEVMRDTSAMLGYVREIEQIPGDYDCPLHGTPLIESRVDTIGGWQSVVSCPAFDGTCNYDPNAAPTQIEPPTEDDDSTKKSSQPMADANTTGGF